MFISNIITANMIIRKKQKESEKYISQSFYRIIWKTESLCLIFDCALYLMSFITQQFLNKFPMEKELFKFTRYYTRIINFNLKNKNIYLTNSYSTFSS